jgi:hypothetical protein
MSETNDGVFDPGAALRAHPDFAAFVEAHPRMDPDKVVELFLVEHPDAVRDLIMPALRRRNIH